MEEACVGACYLFKESVEGPEVSSERAIRQVLSAENSFTAFTTWDFLRKGSENIGIYYGSPRVWRPLFRWGTPRVNLKESVLLCAIVVSAESTLIIVCSIIGI